MSTIGNINLGNLTDYLFVFTDGRNDANWQGATKGYIGDVAINGTLAKERTSGSVAYAGTMYTNDSSFSAWQNILNQNLTQSNGIINEVARIANLELDLKSAFQQINALPATPGFTSVSSTSLNGLNTQNGINEIFVINITSGLSFSSKINITGDPGDIFILRWDIDGNPANGYQGQVKPSSGGAIVPLGGLTPANFINVAGDINASGGGSTPLPPYPQGPRYDDGLGNLIIGGSDFDGGGFFTGYWLTTGKPTTLDPISGLYYGETSPLSNGIFVGGWYSLTTKFSMTSGTSGVYVSPNPATNYEPSISIKKYVSVDEGVTWLDANISPGPNLISPTNPQFKYVVTNTGNQTLTNITVNDSVLGPITLPVTTLDPSESLEVIVVGTWQSGLQFNLATVEGYYNGDPYTDEDGSYYTGVAASIMVKKYVSADGGLTFDDAEVPTGPFIPSNINLVFKYVVTNNGNQPLTDITLNDNIFGPITIPTTTLDPNETFDVIINGTWQEGQQTNIAIVNGTYDDVIYSDQDPANYFGSSNPSISIIKYVSVDNGVTWFDANTPPGPFLPEGVMPQFKYVVTNTGNTIITNITVTDNVLGNIGFIPSLEPGDSVEFIKIQN